MNKKIISLIVFALSIVGCLITAQNVSAETAQLTNEYSGYYWQRIQGNNELHSWYLNWYSFNGRVAYCIEPGVDEGDIYNVGTWENTPYSDAVKQKVLLIAYYGYEYEGHQTAKYRAATQALIWEAVGTGTVTFSTERWMQGTVYDVSAERNEIMKLVNAHYTKPSFNGTTINLKVGESITLTDTNGVLSNYEVYSSDNADVSINGNKLTITAKDVGEISIRLKKKMYLTRQYLVFYGDDAQMMVSAGALDPVYSSINVKVAGGDVEINKYDKDNNSATSQGEASLEGAVYGIYDATTDALITKTTTDATGYAKIIGLPYFGSFYLQEISASTGYELDSTKYYFTSSLSNIDNTIIVWEKVINRDVEITKVYATDESKIMTPEENVEFGFYDKDGNLYTSGTTDTNGKLTVNLVYGTYTVKQLTTSKDTTKVDDFKITVSESGGTIYYTLANAEITARLKVVKVDADTKEVIEQANIKFMIYNVETGEYVSQTITYPTAQTISVFETDENGVLITPYPLVAGTYQLIEVDQVIDGYLWNQEPLEFTIGENSELINDKDYGILLEVSFENTAVKGSVEINKTGEEIILTEDGYTYQEIKLEGVKIGLYANEDIHDALGNLIYEKDTLISELVTDENGYAKLDDLYLGSYYLKEISTLDNYVLDGDKYEFTLTYKDQYTAVIEYAITLHNYVKKGTLEFKKTDIATSETIPNTTIQIYNDSDELIGTYTTNKDGKVVIEELPIGKYYIVEKEAATGYKISEEIIYFEILENGEIVKAQMSDEAITSTIIIHKVDENGNALAGVTIGIYDLEDNLVYSAITDENGLLEVELRYGSYYAKEIATIDGYVLSDEKIYFDVTEDDEEIELSLVNEMMEIEVPNTLANSYINLIAAIIVLGGASIIIISNKRRKR